MVYIKLVKRGCVGLHKASKEGLCMVYIKLVKRVCVWFT